MEAEDILHGGVLIVSQASGISRKTIIKEKKDYREFENNPQYRKLPYKISLSSAHSVGKRLIVISPKRVNLRVTKNIRYASSNKGYIFPIIWRN